MSSEYKIPFDRYQRYCSASEIVEKFRIKNKPLKILEIGSNQHKTLEKFLPNDEIYYLDKEVSVKNKKNKYFIKQDALNMEFNDDTFDVVIALDIFEHIDQKSREQFLFQITRVAKIITIIGFPFLSSKNNFSENYLLEYWKSNLNSDYRWLYEHQINKLPKLNLTKNILNKLGLYFLEFSHGDTSLWTALMKGHFYKEFDHDFRNIQKKIDYFYNKNLFNLDGNSKSSYRYFFIISKDKKKLDPYKLNINNLTNKKSNIFDDLLPIYNSILDHLTFQKKHINFLSQQLIDLNNAKEEQERIISDKERIILDKEKNIQDIIGTKGWRLLNFIKKIFVPLKLINVFIRSIRYRGIIGTFRHSLFLLKNYRLGIIKKILFGTKRYDENYLDWIKKYELFSIDELKNELISFKKLPLISIVMPVYNPNLKWLSEAINSVMNQIYDNWELCISDDASTDEDVKKILNKYQKIDSRIKVIFRKKNGHISEASNSAIKIATGKWIGLLDQDDILSKDALFEVVKSINLNPKLKLIYSDEDKISEKGLRFGPYFKSDWNLDLFYSHNMFSHFGVYKSSLIKSIKGFRKGFEGAQDYDLALRCIEHTKDSEIYHIPKILYHWRFHDGSTSKDAGNKPYAMLAGERSINDHLARTKKNAKAKLLLGGYRVQYALPKILPLVDIIIPTKDNYKILRNCIDSIISKTTYQNFKINIIDNNSSDKETLSYLRNLKDMNNISIFRDKSEFNYSAINNRAVSKIKGEIIVFLNDDIEVITEDWLSEMVSQALREDIGAVGAKLLYPDNTIQHAGLFLGLGGIANSPFHKMFEHDHSNDYFSKSQLLQNFSALTAACMAIKKKDFLHVGGFNENDLSVAFNDVDLCLKLIKHGKRNIWTPYAKLYHHESYSRGPDNTSQKINRFKRETQYMKKEWKNEIASDPYYNINLSNLTPYQLSFPPRNIK